MKLTERNLERLQSSLALVDLLTERKSQTSESLPIEFLMFRHGHIEVRIEAKEGKHRLPHFHIRFKSEYRASYSIDDCKHLKGEMPRRYQEPILEWARENRDRLKSAWDDAMAGKHPVIIEAKASSGT